MLRAYAADANVKLMHTLSDVTSVQPLARAPYVVLFDLKQRRQLAGMYVVYTWSLRSPQNTFRE